MKQWHPILTAGEPEPGVWHLVDGDGRPYAIVEVVRRHGEVGYRVTTWAETLEDRHLVGYWRKLMPAMTGAHEHHQRSTAWSSSAASAPSTQMKSATSR